MDAVLSEGCVSDEGDEAGAEDGEDVDGEGHVSLAVFPVISMGFGSGGAGGVGLDIQPRQIISASSSACGVSSRLKRFRKRRRGPGLSS